MTNASDPRQAEESLPESYYVPLNLTGDWRIAEAADELVRSVNSAAERLARLDATAAAERPASGKWSIKEIIGHLIDSAANNHQRFVRAQYENPVELPGYAQDFWVDAQGYAQAGWPDVIHFWRLYNLHLANIIRRIPKDKLAVDCRIGPYDPVPLGFLIEDYVGHLSHHLQQIDRLI